MIRVLLILYLVFTGLQTYGHVEGSYNLHRMKGDETSISPGNNKINDELIKVTPCYTVILYSKLTTCTFKSLNKYAESVAKEKEIILMYESFKLINVYFIVPFIHSP